MMCLEQRIIELTLFKPGIHKITVNSLKPKEVEVLAGHHFSRGVSKRKGMIEEINKFIKNDRSLS